MFKLLLESSRCGYYEHKGCHNIKHEFTNKSGSLSYSLGDCKKELCPLVNGEYLEELDTELKDIKGEYRLEWP